MRARQPRCEQLYQVGEELIASKHHARDDIQAHINSLKDKWQRLLDLVARRRARLEDAQESHQVRVVFVFPFISSGRHLSSIVSPEYIFVNFVFSENKISPTIFLENLYDV